MPIIRLIGGLDEGYLNVLDDEGNSLKGNFGPFDDEKLELQLTKIRLDPAEIEKLMREYRRSSKAELSVPTVWGRSTFPKEPTS